MKELCKHIWKTALGDFSGLHLCWAAWCKMWGRIEGADVCAAAAALTMKETESDDVANLLEEGTMSRGSVQE